MSDPRLRLKPRLARGCRLVEGGTLHLPEGILKLSPTGLRIVELCDGARTVGEIVARVCEGYAPELHGRIEADVLEYLARLNERAAVELGS